MQTSKQAWEKMPVKPAQGPDATCLLRGQGGILQNRGVSDISLQRTEWIIHSRACLFGDFFQYSYSALALLGNDVSESKDFILN